MMTFREIKREARTALKGYWSRMMGITVLALFLGVYSFGPLPKMVYAIKEITANPQLILEKGAFAYSVGTLRTALIFLLGAGVSLGECLCYMHIAEGSGCNYRKLFEGLPMIVPAIGIRVIRWLLVVLGTMFCVIPGLYAYYQFALAPWIMAERNTGTKETLAFSRVLIRGHMVDLFFFDLSFTGWALLSCFSLDVGLLFLIPYHSTARTIFYKNLCEVT